jgi:WD40 repeat protein
MLSGKLLENVNALDTVDVTAVNVGLIKLPDPATLPAGGAIGGLAFSPNGDYLAVRHSTAPRLTIYKRSGDTFTKLTDPSTLPTSNPNDDRGNQISFSTDGTYLAVSNGSGVIMYKRNGDTFSPLSFSYSGNTVLSVRFSLDGIYFGVGTFGTNAVNIYKRNGDSFSLLSRPSGTPESDVFDFAFSSNSNYLAIGSGQAPYLYVFKRSGDTFTLLPTPTGRIGVFHYGLIFSSDDSYLAIAHWSAGQVSVYERDGDTFTRLPGPDIPAPGTFGVGIAKSSDDNYLAVVVWSGTNGTNLTLYKRSGNTFVKIARPAVLPPVEAYKVVISSDDSYLAVAHSGSPFITIYKKQGDWEDKDFVIEKSENLFKINYTLPENQEIDALGVAQQSGSTDDIIDVDVIFQK